MNTIGYLFILIAILLIRQVARGRVMNLGEDLTDAFIAVVSGDSDALGGVLTRTGDSNEVSLSPVKTTADINSGSGTNAAAKGLLAAAVARGKRAKGYKWTATGPDYYDCSGLMYRAAQDCGYAGPRFVTATVAGMPGFKKIDAPGGQGTPATVGDVVVWPGHHMGVISGPNQFYSARNVKSGIGYAKIDGFRKERPIYLRLVTASGTTKGL